MEFFIALVVPLLVILTVQGLVFALWPQAKASEDESREDALVDAGTAKAIKGAKKSSSAEASLRAGAGSNLGQEFFNNVEVPLDGIAENSPAMVSAKNAVYREMRANPHYEVSPPNFVLADFSGRDT